MILKVMSLIQTQSSHHIDVKARDLFNHQKSDVLLTETAHGESAASLLKEKLSDDAVQEHKALNGADDISDRNSPWEPTSSDQFRSTSNDGDASCTSDSKQEKREFVHSSSTEYPNGSVKWSRKIEEIEEGEKAYESRGVGWAMVVYGHNGNDASARRSYNKSCLGVYQCPHFQCPFVERPRIGRKKKYALPKPAQKECKSPLEHVPCKATLTVHECAGTIEFLHDGVHNHALPQPIRPDIQFKRKFVEIAAPEALPKNLVFRNSTRAPVTDALRRKVLNSTNTATRINDSLDAIASYEARVLSGMGKKLMRSSSLSSEDGHITFQSNFMVELTGILESCMQTDSVHGFIVSDHFNDVNVTFTSRYCTVINRNVPLLISFMFGKSKLHYKQHFLALFRSMNLTTWQDFENGFPGMTCDFSEAECLGFESAVRTYYNLAEDYDLQFERFYRFCSPFPAHTYKGST